MKKLLAIVALINVILLFSACATIVSGTGQTISIRTDPVEGAHCELSNGKGKWQVVTPASVEIQKSIGDLRIICHKEGYEFEEMVIPSKGRPMLLGGIVGVGVDTATGAAFKYPEIITVPLKKK